MLSHVLVCALPVNRSFVTVMKNMSDAKSVTFEMIRDKWSLFMDQIVVGFLLPLADRGVVYADLRPGLANVRFTPDEQFDLLDLESLRTSGSIERWCDVRYPQHGLGVEQFVLAQVVLIAFNADLSVEYGFDISRAEAALHERISGLPHWAADMRVGSSVLQAATRKFDVDLDVVNNAFDEIRRWGDSGREERPKGSKGGKDKGKCRAGKGGQGRRGKSRRKGRDEPES